MLFEDKISLKKDLLRNANHAFFFDFYFIFKKKSERKRTYKFCIIELHRLYFLIPSSHNRFFYRKIYLKFWEMKKKSSKICLRKQKTIRVLCTKNIWKGWRKMSWYIIFGPNTENYIMEFIEVFLKWRFIVGCLFCIKNLKNCEK